MSTAEAAYGRAGRVGIGEHDEEVAHRQVRLIARYHENGSKLRLREAEERSQETTNNILHVFMHLYQLLVWCTRVNNKLAGT